MPCFTHFEVIFLFSLSEREIILMQNKVSTWIQSLCFYSTENALDAYLIHSKSDFFSLFFYSLFHLIQCKHFCLVHFVSVSLVLFSVAFRLFPFRCRHIEFECALSASRWQPHIHTFTEWQMREKRSKRMKAKKRRRA